MDMNTTLVINNIDKETIESLKAQAKQRGVKLEEFIGEIIKKEIQPHRKINEIEVYHDLDRFAGTWSKEQVEEFYRSTTDFNQIEERLWQ